MKMSSATRIAVGGIAALAASGCWADAATSKATPPIEMAVIEKLDLPALAEVRHNPFDSRPIAARQLAIRRGGDAVFSQNRLKGVVADNSASNLTTGMNVISEGAFAGSQGLPMVIQNSGNNVLIQNSTIVNVQVK